MTKLTEIIKFTKYRHQIFGYKLMMIASIIVLGILGLFFGSGLAYASKKFAVIVDPKVEQILSVLSGANCAACGVPGCAAYAEAVAAGRVPPNKCIPGGIDTAEKVAFIMGLTDVEVDEPKVVVIHCQGGWAEAKERFIYQGLEDCRAALLISGGSKACRYGCLGLGSCAKSCPFDAIRMNENGLPIVSEEKCTGCGVCVLSCPRAIISLIPVEQKVYLACCSLDKAKAVKDVCSVGCFACKICVSPKVTPSAAIIMEGNLPEIKDTLSNEIYTAVEKCPAGCFVIRSMRDDSAIKVEQEEKKLAS